MWIAATSFQIEFPIEVKPDRRRYRIGLWKKDQQFTPPSFPLCRERIFWDYQPVAVLFVVHDTFVLGVMRRDRQHLSQYPFVSVLRHIPALSSNCIDRILSWLGRRNWRSGTLGR